MARGPWRTRSAGSAARAHGRAHSLGRPAGPAHQLPLPPPPAADAPAPRHRPLRSLPTGQPLGGAARRHNNTNVICRCRSGCSSMISGRHDGLAPHGVCTHRAPTPRPAPLQAPSAPAGAAPACIAPPACPNTLAALLRLSSSLEAGHPARQTPLQSSCVGPGGPEPPGPLDTRRRPRRIDRPPDRLFRPR